VEKQVPERVSYNDAWLVEENERLRSTIKVMRADIELLQNQSMTHSVSADSTKNILLETTIKLCHEEISKLRNEKRKLMEIGNEMRSKLTEFRNNENISTSISSSTQPIIQNHSSLLLTQNIDGSDCKVEKQSLDIKNNTPTDPCLLMPATSSKSATVCKDADVVQLEVRQMTMSSKPTFNQRYHILSRSSPSISREKVVNGNNHNNNDKTNNFRNKNTSIQSYRKVSNYNTLRLAPEGV